jgi:hypothetical protein
MIDKSRVNKWKMFSQKQCWHISLITKHIMQMMLMFNYIYNKNF